METNSIATSVVMMAYTTSFPKLWAMNVGFSQASLCLGIIQPCVWVSIHCCNVVSVGMPSCFTVTISIDTNLGCELILIETYF